MGKFTIGTFQEKERGRFDGRSQESKNKGQGGSKPPWKNRNSNDERRNGNDSKPRGNQNAQGSKGNEKRPYFEMRKDVTEPRNRDRPPPRKNDDSEKEKPKAGESKEQKEEEGSFSPRREPRDDSKLECFRCKTVGHRSRNCPTWTKALDKARQYQTICTKCNRKGHTHDVCRTAQDFPVSNGKEHDNRNKTPPPPKSSEN